MGLQNLAGILTSSGVLWILLGICHCGADWVLCCYQQCDSHQAQCSRGNTRQTRPGRGTNHHMCRSPPAPPTPCTVGVPVDAKALSHSWPITMSSCLVLPPTRTTHTCQEFLVSYTTGQMMNLGEQTLHILSTIHVGDNFWHFYSPCYLSPCIWGMTFQMEPKTASIIRPLWNHKT